MGIVLFLRSSFIHCIHSYKINIMCCAHIYVTPSQFRQCLSYLGLQASAEELKMMELRFSDSKGFNYLLFLEELYYPMENWRINIRQGPASCWQREREGGDVYAVYYYCTCLYDNYWFLVHVHVQCTLHVSCINHLNSCILKSSYHCSLVILSAV